MMIVRFFSDSHLNHANIATYCDRPEGFTGIIIKRWNEIVKPDDLTIHLGDVAIGPRELVEFQVRSLAGRKVLVRGNHDQRGSNVWWMEHGFDFACDAMEFRGLWLTHEPAKVLPEGCKLNIHGHLHNIWGKKVPIEGGKQQRDSKEKAPSCFSAPNQQGFIIHDKLYNPWQRLFACEYTDYKPIEIDEFVDHPGKYQATGPKR